MHDDDIYVIVVFLNLNMEAWLLRFPHMKLKSTSLSLLNLHIQGIPRLIDKVMPILDDPPYLLI